MRQLSLASLISLSMLATLLSAERAAFVVGNSAYTTFSALDNPQQDHDQMVAALESLDFAVTHGDDITISTLRTALPKFVAKHPDAKEIVFYYSGHGIQVHGENYLTGIDSALDTTAREAELRRVLKGDDLTRQLEIEVRREAARTMLPLSEVTTSLEGMGDTKAVRIVILDCCRDNPLGTKNIALAGKGLGRVDPASGMLIAFAAREGTVARQTKRGEPSLYTAKLLPHLLTSGLLVEEVFKRTRIDVMAASGRAQVPAEYSLLTGSLIFKPAPRATIAPAEPRPLAPAPRGAALATKASPFTNSLGMKFVPAGTKGVLFSVHETRRQDYASYAASEAGVDDSWEAAEWGGDHPVGHKDDHPVVSVSHEDATAFCQWLTDRERGRGSIGAADRYRLPKDHEWSVAVGIGDREDPRATPEAKDGKIEGIYPWGTAWPPPKGAGNFADETAKSSGAVSSNIEGYDDGHATTAPTGSFIANTYGLYDLSGNVWEWCEDRYDPATTLRVLRGGSWYYNSSSYLSSSFRLYLHPSSRITFLGFRVVLELGGDG